MKEIGKKILSGNFNLTKVSFPIKAMISKSNLESSVWGSIVINKWLKLVCFHCTLRKHHK